VSYPRSLGSKGIKVGARGPGEREGGGLQ
jgi:hypothetical protein